MLPGVERTVASAASLHGRQGLRWCVSVQPLAPSPHFDFHSAVLMHSWSYIIPRRSPPSSRSLFFLLSPPNSHSLLHNHS